MFAVGCIQSQSCHTNRCPTGVATQDRLRQRALVVEDKATRVFNYRRNTMKALGEILASAGLEHPDELGPHHLARRTSTTEIKIFSQIHYFAKPGELLDGASASEFYRAGWDMARGTASTRSGFRVAPI